MFNRLNWLVFLWAFALTTRVSAWEGHYMLTFAALRDWPSVGQEPNIMPEELENFVQAEKNSLVLILRDYEAWAQKNITSYPPLPPKLAFDGQASVEQGLVKKFLMSLRVNPELSYHNFLLYPQWAPHRINQQFSATEQIQPPLPSLAALRSETPVLTKILPGQPVSALEILTAGSEEPDHGLDIGLWQDNQNQFGPLMGLGLQPFGNPVLAYSSQAPLHMGFYHEALMMYWAAPWLKRCFPEYRISLFLTLAQHAMSTGHTYWGYRFLGWALHYIQDLTQPYHATVAPGVWWPKLIAFSLLEIIGYKTPANHMRQLLTNRHLALENYQFESIRTLPTNGTLAKALTDVPHDLTYPAFDLNYPRSVIALEAHSRANLTDALLVEAMPKLYVNDPTYIFTGTDPAINLRGLIKDQTIAKKLDADFITLMQACGSHSRKMLGHQLEKIK